MEKSWNFPTRTSLFYFKNGNLKTGTFADEMIISQPDVFENTFFEKITVRKIIDKQSPIQYNIFTQLHLE